MLSAKVLTRANVGRIANYYEDGADDYYAKEGDAAVWAGKGVVALGLSGAIDNPQAHARFRELLGGEVDGTGAVRNSKRSDAKERMGVDLTFSAPKSVSLEALVGGNRDMIAAHDRAVRATIDEIETLAMARQKVKGQTRVENTGNVIAAVFRHETTREKDPELHSHAVLMNLTQRADGEWRALRNDDILKQIKYFGASYRARLADELQKQGHALRFNKDGTFELASYTREQIEAFSQRSAQITDNLAQKGLDRNIASTAQKQLATLATRASKKQDDPENIYRAWQERARSLGIEFGRTVPEAPGIEQQAYSRIMAEAGREEADKSIRYAVAHLTERNAVMTERALTQVAGDHVGGRPTFDQVRDAVTRAQASGAIVNEDIRYRTGDAFSASETRATRATALAATGMTLEQARAQVDAAIDKGQLVATERHFTTPKLIEREQAISNREIAGRGATTPILSADLAMRSAAKQLSPDQRSAVGLLLGAENRFVGVHGKTGTGKTYMLGEAIRLAEQEGYQVKVIAPYGAQVANLKKDGIAATTVASFLKKEDRGLDDKTLLVVDEAGLLPTRRIHRRHAARQRDREWPTIRPTYRQWHDHSGAHDRLSPDR